MYEEIGDANHIIDTLKLELANAKVKKSHKRTKSDTPEELLTADQEIAKLAQIYLLFHQPWIHTNDFCRSKPSFNFNNSEQYLTDDNMALGANAELYECIPECLHEYMKSHSNFGAKVSSYSIKSKYIFTLFMVYEGAFIQPLQHG